MKKLINISVLTALLMLSSIPFLKAQGFDVGADIYSRYVWRGLDFGNSPSIQPTLSFTKGGFEIGYWGAYSTTNVNYQETDLYLNYTIKDVISIGITDYFFPLANVAKNKYFEYGEDNTGHIFEGNLNFNGIEKFPVYVSLNYNFYGADKDNSFYAEAGYNGTCKKVDYSVFAGFTTGKGIYLPDGADGLSFVNVGFSVSKEIPITEKFSLPVSSALIFNPQAENIFLVFGISL